MDRKLKIVRIPQHSDEWYEFRRTQGIGGSEIGSLLGQNPYETAVEIYHRKLGTIAPDIGDNEKMFWGREHEDKIADIWQYWDGSKFGYLENYKHNRIIRKCRKVNGFVINPDFPWLFASIDRLINKNHGMNMITGKQLEKESVLETKTLSFWAAQAWEDRFPRYYVTQIHQYMLITECYYAEVAILKDGNELDVIYIQRNEEIIEELIRDSKAFWYDRVLPAQKAKESRDMADIVGDIDTAEENEGIIQRLEPDPDSTMKYREFMSEKFLRERDYAKGTVSMYDLCKRDEVLKMLGKKVYEQRNLIKNYLVRYLKVNGADVIDFGKLGTVRWYLKKGFKNRTLTVNIREKPTEEKIEQEFHKFNQRCY